MEGVYHFISFFVFLLSHKRLDSLEPSMPEFPVPDEQFFLSFYYVLIYLVHHRQVNPLFCDIWFDPIID